MFHIFFIKTNNNVVIDKLKGEISVHIIDVISDDNSLKNNIFELFIKKKSIIISNSGITLKGRNYLINISDIPIKNNVKKIVMLSKKNYEDILLSKNDICIVKNDDINALRILKRYHSPAVTCGLNLNDTLTFSSISTQHILSLQRAVEAINGNIIEPKEFKSRFYTENKYNELMINALFLLTET